MKIEKTGQKLAGFLLLRFEAAPLHHAQTHRQEDGAEGNADDQAAPVTIRAERGEVGDGPAGGQADDPVRDDREQECHVDILVAAQRYLQRRIDTVGQLQEDGHTELVGL